MSKFIVASLGVASASSAFASAADTSAASLPWYGNGDTVNQTNTLNQETSSSSDTPTLGFFFESLNIPTQVSYPINESSLNWLNDVVHYRNIPGVFPDGMDYFFDGLTTIVKFSFQDGLLNITSKGFESKAYEVRLYINLFLLLLQFCAVLCVAILCDVVLFHHHQYYHHHYYHYHHHYHHYYHYHHHHYHYYYYHYYHHHQYHHYY
jgi:hypothetical protein